jgi:5-methylcytosine-specific restriction endonuclease McrA
MKGLAVLCGEPGCNEVQEDGRVRCEAHRRPGGPSKGSGSYGRGWWVRLRARFLAKHRWCEWCGERAVTADHIVPRVPDSPYQPHGQDAESNLQALCRRCAGRKTSAFDGGFGNRRREYTGPLPEKSGRSA